MIVYFERANGEWVNLGTAENFKEVCQTIMKFLNAHNFHPYYFRWWREQNGLWKCDVGSWSEFFVIEGADETFLEGNK